MQLAQATGMPSNGASNAHDFQPPTRNPQSEAVPTQPQASDLQTPTSAEVLSDQNLQITVPGSTGGTRHVQQENAPDAGGGELLVFTLLLVVVVVSGALLWLGRRRSSKQAIQEAAEVFAESSESVVLPPPAKKPKKTKKKKRKKRK
jgi:hypothetical protein